MNKRIRVGIIGTGFGAKVHAPIMSTLPDFEVAAISSVYRHDQVDVIKSQLGLINVYTNWKEMLEKEILDLVVIASIPSLHYEMVLECFKHNLHVLCEKPIALNTLQAQQMIDARDRVKKIAAVNFEFRFFPARLKVKEIIQSGILGNIMHLSYRGNLKAYNSSINKRRYWLGKRLEGGGVLGAVGSHMFDSILWWTEDRVAELFANTTVHISKCLNEVGKQIEVRDAEDTFQVIGKLDNNVTFTVELLHPTRQRNYMWYLEIYGTKGSVTLMDDELVMLGVGDGELEKIELQQTIIPKNLDSFASFFYPIYKPLLQNLIKKIRNEKANVMIPSFEDGLAVQHILDSIQKSSITGTKIKLF